MRPLNRSQELFTVLALRASSWSHKPNLHQQKIQVLQRRGLMDSQGILNDAGLVKANQVQRRMYFNKCAVLRIDYPYPGSLEMVQDPKGYYPPIAFEDIRRFGLVAYRKKSGFKYIKRIFETVSPREIYMIGLGLLFYEGEHKIDETSMLDQIFASIPRPESEKGGSCVISWQ